MKTKIKIDISIVKRYYYKFSMSMRFFVDAEINLKYFNAKFWEIVVDVGSPLMPRMKENIQEDGAVLIKPSAWKIGGEGLFWAL